MQGDRLQQAETIFGLLVNTAPEKRGALLAQHCGEDSELRAFVERLLRHHETGGGGALDPPVAGLAAGAPNASAASSGASAPAAGDTVAALGTSGRTLDPYVLRERLGAGGMGEVWRAEQMKPIRRTVAVKLIKAGMDTEQVIARFEAERQALALMDHPAIARVLDAGTTPEGRPYFVMEHVPGIPITEYCDRRRLDTKERLALFVRVCEAVQHAHQKAVIHRDLKPSNILVSEVDGKPQPKIIDFGVAKAMSQKLTERTMYTALGQVVGTPAYMSPEQAELSGLDVDTRTDVYALGVLLYELLTGTLPFETTTLREAGLDAMRRIIREEEPPRPSTRISTLGEVAREAASRRRTDPARWRKALRRELDWITMKALEKDRSRRYETASAMAADIGRYLADQPVAAGPPSAAYRLQKYVKRHRVAVGVAAALVLVAALSYVQTSIQNARTAAARDEAVLAISSLEEMLASVDPTRSGRDVTVREILDETARTLGETYKEQPLVEARLRHTVGRTYSRLGEYDDAEKHLERAVEIWHQHLGNGDPSTVEAMNDLCLVYLRRGQYEKAEELGLETVEVARRALGKKHPATLAAMHVLAAVYARQERLHEAEMLGVETLEARRRIFGEEHPGTLATLGNLAAVYVRQGRYDEAEALQHETLEIQRRIQGEEHPSTLTAMGNLAATYWSLGRHGDAQALSREILEIQRRVLGDEHPGTLLTMRNLGIYCFELGLYEQADSLYQRVLEGRRHVLGDEHHETLTSMHDLAKLYHELGRLEDASTLFREILETSRRALGDAHPTTLHAVIHVAISHAEHGHRDESKRMMQESVEVCRRAFGDGDERTNQQRYNAACVAALDGRRDDAIAHLRRALTLGYSYHAEAIRGDPDFASLLGDPEFETIVDELNRRFEAETAAASTAGTR